MTPHAEPEPYASEQEEEEVLPQEESPVRLNQQASVEQQISGALASVAAAAGPFSGRAGDGTQGQPLTQPLTQPPGSELPSVSGAAGEPLLKLKRTHGVSLQEVHPQANPWKATNSFLDSDPLEKFNCPRDAYEKVMGVLAVGGHLSDNCRKMLRVMVPTSLVVPADHRCKEQTMVVGMLEQTLHQSLAKLEAAAKHAREAAVSSRTTAASANSKVAKAELALVQAQEYLDDKKLSWSKVQSAHEAAKQTHSVKTTELNARVSLAELKADYKTFETIFTDYWSVLFDGRWSDQDHARKMLRKLAPLWDKLSIEDSMQAALPRALLKKPPQRGPFDKMIVEQCDEQLQVKVKDLRTQFRSSQTGELDRAVTKAERRMDNSAKALQASKEEFFDAQAVYRQANEAMHVAEGSLDSAEPEQREKDAATATAESALEDFKVGPLESFRMLRDRRMNVDVPELTEELVGVEGEAHAEAEPLVQVV